jgi:UDP-N-acetylmuramate dehydrogenase
MKRWFGHIPGTRILVDRPMQQYTSIRIGGRADYLVRVYSVRSLQRILRIIQDRRIRCFVIGAGTNLLVDDRGYRGVVLKLEGGFKRIIQDENRFLCGAGVRLDDLVCRVTRLGYKGAEFLSGIPGTVGGAVKGNAGAFGRAIADIVDQVMIVDGRRGEQTLKRADVDFGYRTSGIKNGVIITGVQIRLRKGDRRSLLRRIRRITEERRRRHPDDWSAGSFFKNPAGLSAGRLIESCGLKGMRIGDAAVSEKHANFIVNLGQAKSADVLRLARLIKQTVRKKRRVTLKEEVRILRP